METPIRVYGEKYPTVQRRASSYGFLREPVEQTGSRYTRSMAPHQQPIASRVETPVCACGENRPIGWFSGEHNPAGLQYTVEREENCDIQSMASHQSTASPASTSNYPAHGNSTAPIFFGCRSSEQKAVTPRAWHLINPSSSRH